MGKASVKHFDICIIGGGAAGLVASIKAAQQNPSFSVAIIEKMEEPGKKVAASGNGRCNLSNIKSPDWEKTSAFFSDLGLITRVDNDGRVYPYSEDGRDVVRCLVAEAKRLGVEIITRRAVAEIEKNESEFVLRAIFNKPKAHHSSEEDQNLIISSKSVLLTTGGKSKPKLGTTGDGFSLAKKLGHSINKLIPVLTGVETRENIKEMGISGIREKCAVSLFKRGELIFRDKGEIQFTDYGISGIVVFDMTRFMDMDDDKGFDEYVVSIDYLPDVKEDTLKKMILERERKMPVNNNDYSELIRSWVKEPLAKAISKRVSIEPELTKELKDFRLSPKNLKGWDMAQVTRGGVPLNEVDSETGESKLVKGLFFAGEILDSDFQCGGFNLQYAWSTGIKAGERMGGRLD